MSEYHKELLNGIVKDWTIEQIEDYIAQLEKRAEGLNDWIKHLKTIRKKKARKTSPDTGARDGR